MTNKMIFKPKLQELGRIRTGDQVASGKSGAKRPNRLETFRLTSDNKPRLDHIVDKLGWGAEVSEWVDAPQGRQWQVYTNLDMLMVVVPPFSSIDQCNEVWEGSECKLRCDGEKATHAWESKALQLTADDCATLLEKQSCLCAWRYPDVEERIAVASTGKACKTVTRLNVYLPDVPGLGVWRLETRGFYSGSELIGMAPILEQLSADGQNVVCQLKIEQRKRRTKGQTRVFPVVTLQPAELTMGQMLTGNIPQTSLLSAVVPEERRLAEANEAVELLYGQPGDLGEPIEEPFDPVESARLDAELAAKEAQQESLL